MSLRPNQRCPIHSLFTCCGREAAERREKHSKYERIAPGIRRTPDGRELCSEAEKRRRKDILLAKHPYCIACNEKFTHYDEVELGHRESKGMNGWKRNDAWSNLVLLHKTENREQGSRSLDDYLADPNRIGARA